jgi:NmrA-like family
MAGKATATLFKVTQKDKPFQLISVKDIGNLAAKAFIDPDEFAGKSMGIASDELSFDQMNKIFKEKFGTGLPVTFDFVGKGINWAVKELSSMLKWFVSDGYGVNIEDVKKVLPDILTWEAWLEKESTWAKKD